MGLPVGRRLGLAGLGWEMQTRHKAVAGSSCNREGEAFWDLGGVGLPWSVVSVGGQRPLPGGNAATSTHVAERTLTLVAIERFCGSLEANRASALAVARTSPKQKQHREVTGL